MKNSKIHFYNVCAFLLTLFLYITTAYSLYSNIRNTWLITPPNYVLFMLSILTLILGIMGFSDKSSWIAKMRSWLTTIFSSLLILLLCIAMLFTGIFSGEKEWIKTVTSPDDQYTIDFYYTDAGARGTFGILGEINGLLWFKKKVFFEKRAEEVNIQWENNHTIIINEHKLNLKGEETIQ